MTSAALTMRMAARRRARAVPLPGAPDLSAERALLLAAARRALEPADREELVRAAAGVTAWEAVPPLAVRNGMTPLLAHHLAATRAPVPDGVLRRLADRAREDAHRALHLAAELRRLMEALEAAGVAAAAYKGPALGVRAYGDVGLRPCRDLDLLVRPADLARAGEVLRARGFVERRPLSPARDACFRAADGDYSFDHADGRLVELHCRVSPARFAVRLPAEGVLERAVRLPVGGGDVPAPADADLLLALAVHGAKHRWERLEWLASFAEVARTTRVDAAFLLERAAAAGARRPLLLAMGMAHALLDAPVDPAFVARADADAGLRALAAEADARLFRPPAADEPDDTAARVWYNLRARDGWGDRAVSAWRWLTVPSPEDWEAVDLPDALFGAYRLLRPARLLWRHGPGRLLR